MVGVKLFAGLDTPIIGALHLTPLLGYPGFSGLDSILDTALEDLRAFEAGGVDGIIIENNYDLPHKVSVNPETIAAMTSIGSDIIKRTKLHVGISVLWNDYKAALSIAKVIGAEFVRVPVFVDSVETDFGIIHAEPKNVIDYRRSIDAENVRILADIQVKHAKMLKERPISDSAKEAQRMGADAVIVTGKWTGDAPKVERLIEVKGSTKLPVVIGSGLDCTNAAELLKYADSAIVSTSLKEGSAVDGERNVKPYGVRMDKTKIKKLMAVVSGLRKAHKSAQACEAGQRVE